jgi:hypothetical protein
MKYRVAFIIALAVVGAAFAAGAQPEPYDSSPTTYPWRNGVIEGPAGGPGGYAYGNGYGYDASFNGYGGVGPAGGPVPVNGYGAGGGYYPGYGYATVPYGGQQIYPLPGGGGGFSVSQTQDGSLNVTRFGPVWSSQLAPDGGARRRYFNYGGGGGFWSFIGSLWPF